MEKIIDILLVEDDNLDAMDIQRTLDKMGILYRLNLAKNGEEALDILNGRTGGSLPDVTLIDINMPRMNGIEFLNIVRNKEEWKRMKCFVITTSEERVDKEAAKSLGISGYIIKPFKINNPSSIDSFNLMIDLMNMKGTS